MIPIYGPWKLPRGGPDETDGLTGLRSIFVGLVSALFLFLVVLSFIAPWNGRGGAGWVLGLVLLLGAIGLARVRAARNRPLKIESRDKLVNSYRAIFFIGVAFAEMPALVAFVGVLFADKLWLYLVGLTFALLGLALIAPTRADIERRQQQIAAQGSSLSLLEALMAPQPRNSRDDAS